MAKMTPEAHEALMEKNALRKEARDAFRSNPILKVGNLKLVRFDKYNLAIMSTVEKDDGDEGDMIKGYFTDLQSAVQSMWRMTTSNTHKRDLASLHKAISESEQRLIEAVRQIDPQDIKDVDRCISGRSKTTR